MVGDFEGTPEVLRWKTSGGVSIFYFHAEPLDTVIPL